MPVKKAFKINMADVTAIEENSIIMNRPLPAGFGVPFALTLTGKIPFLYRPKDRSLVVFCFFFPFLNDGGRGGSLPTLATFSNNTTVARLSLFLMGKGLLFQKQYLKLKGEKL